MSTPALALVVDDSRVNRLVAAKMLQALGFAVEEAADGAEALKKCHTRTYAVILMDVMMPNLDGFGATRSIRNLEIPNGRRTPIIGITAHAARQECLEAGMDEFIQKPVTLSRLVDKLQAWFGGLAA